VETLLFATMSTGENDAVKQLRALIEEDQQIIRKLRQEIDRLRFLLGLQSLHNVESAPNSVIAPSRNQHLHADFSN
jgi:hypothetical protein